MFWNYEEWTNAFLIQLVAIIVAFIVGRKNQVKNDDILLVISLICPVALFNFSEGVAGAFFLSDIAGIYLLFRKNNTLIKKKFIVLAFFLFLGWPILSTLLAIIFDVYSSKIIDIDSKIMAVQFLRYFLYFILLVRLVSKPFQNSTYILKLFKVQSIMISFVFSAILLGYLNILKVDAWNELIGISEVFIDNSLGKGGMFLYRGGIGTLSTISILIIYFCFLVSKGFYKYLMLFMIFIILITVIFSGSRQGISLTLLSLIVVILLIKQYVKAFQILLFGFVFFFFILQNDAIQESTEWVLNRYELLLSDEADVRVAVQERNFSIEIAEKNKKDFFYEINGFGLGGRIKSTESDYYNTYSYFGIIGSIIYYLFIFYCIYKIYINWKSVNDIKWKNIFLISLVLALIMPIYGFQQWYIMTFASHSAMNIYLILFLISLALRSLKAPDREFKY